MKRELPRHSVSVGAVVVHDDGRILAVQRRDTGAWVTPGGVLELDETPEDGVVREVAEEACIPVEVERLTGVYKNIATGVISLVFRCHPIGPVEPQPSEEAQQTRWLTQYDASRLMADAFATRVKDALTSGDGAIVRTVSDRNIMAPKDSAAVPFERATR